MDQKNIPGYEVVRGKIEQINKEIMTDQISYDPDSMTYKFYLSKNEKACEVILPRAFLDDLNDYKGSKTSGYWLTLESELARKINIPLYSSGMIPSISDIFFENKLDWEIDNNQLTEVSFSSDDYEIIQDGLKKLYHCLDSQRAALSNLKLKRYPYDEDQEYIKDMLLYRNRQISEHGPSDFRDRISVTTRKHLKAAALIELMFLEKEILQGKYSAVIKKEITAKISKILSLLSLPIFSKIAVAEYLFESQEETKSQQDNQKEADDTMLRKYDVVLSFAGEDREHAERLACLLKRDNFTVYYDKDEEHNLWGKNLYEHLTEVYSKYGRYCVMFLSKDYAGKQWPNLERKSAQERAFKENREYILPIRIDDTEIPGILGTVGYQDLLEKSIEAIYEILKQKLLTVDNTQSQIKYGIRSTGLSSNAEKLLKIFSDKSENALLNDPMLEAKEVIDALQLPEDEVAEAVDELKEKGFINLHKSLGMGKLGFTRIAATERLFAKTDSFLKSWDPDKDSKDLAVVLVNISQEGHSASILKADEILKWGPRRLNPALFLLIDKDLVDPSKTLNPTYHAIYVILKPRIRRYIKGDLGIL